MINHEFRRRLVEGVLGVAFEPSCRIDLEAGLSFAFDVFSRFRVLLSPEMLHVQQAAPVQYDLGIYIRLYTPWGYHANARAQTRRDNERTNHSSHVETSDELYAEAEIRHIMVSTSSVTCIRAC
jgi:hypothetical protein